MKSRRPQTRTIAVYGGLALAVLFVVLVEGFVNRRIEAEMLPPGLGAAPADQAEVAAPRRRAADVRAVFAGRQLADFYCAACHVSAYPTLSEQTPDEALYRVIADGSPAGVTHTFNSQLTDEQIWQLVAYLRTQEQQITQSSPLVTLWTPTPALSDATAAVDRPEPLPPLVFARRGVIWRSTGGASPLDALTQANPDAYADQPAYAPATGQVAFTLSSPVDGGALVTMRLDGSDRRTVWQVDTGRFSLPSWTLDGTALLVTYTGPSTAGESYADWRPQLVHIDLASGARRVVVEHAHSPALSHDGRLLAYVQVSTDRLRSSLVIAQADGSNPRVLLRGEQFVGFFAPRFAPDGKALVVAALGGPATGISTDSRGQWMSGPPLDWLAPPVAEAHGTPPWDVWQVMVNGTGARRLAALQEDLPMAAFSPDGSEIVVMGYRGMYRMRADGTHLRRISLIGDHGALDWVR